MTIFVICVGSSLLSKATDVTLSAERKGVVWGMTVEEWLASWRFYNHMSFKQPHIAS